MSKMKTEGYRAVRSCRVIERIGQAKRTGRGGDKSGEMIE